MVSETLLEDERDKTNRVIIKFFDLKFPRPNGIAMYRMAELQWNTKGPFRIERTNMHAFKLLFAITIVFLQGHYKGMGLEWSTIDVDSSMGSFSRSRS